MKQIVNLQEEKTFADIVDEIMEEKRNNMKNKMCKLLSRFFILACLSSGILSIFTALCGYDIDTIIGFSIVGCFSMIMFYVAKFIIKGDKQ